MMAITLQPSAQIPRHRKENVLAQNMCFPLRTKSVNSAPKEFNGCSKKLP